MQAEFLAMTRTKKSICLHVYDAELSSIHVFCYLGMTVLIAKFKLLIAYEKVVNRMWKH